MKSKLLSKLLWIALTISVAHAQVSWERLQNVQKEPQNWLTYGGTYKAWRYSPLDQIKRSNIKQLVPV